MGDIVMRKQKQKQKKQNLYKTQGGWELCRKTLTH